MRNLLWGVVVLTYAGCARVMPPPGGERDEEPPRIVETDPVQNLMAMNFAGTDRPVRIVFHETLSERSPREMVQVSPETGEVHVDRDGKELIVTIEGGWQEGRVYRVTVLPGIVDRHGNARPAAHELVFSTGAAILPNALGGIATDRITGRPVANARVEARSQADSTTYTTVTDSSGFFALRSLPAGAYATLVYVDQNRNRANDVFEASASSDVNIGASDTLAIELAVLGRDTTPARLVRAEIRDSIQVRLNFDDYMEGTAPLTGIRVNAWLLPDSSAITGGSLMTPGTFQASRADTTRITSPRLPTPAQDTTRVLPTNELVWIPATPLRPGARYRFTVTGYRNLHGLPDGGGSVTATAPARVTPAPADTSAARRDSTTIPRDTTRQ